MLQKGKVEIVKYEMAQLRINVLEMTIHSLEMNSNDDYKSDGFRVIHSGGEESERGIAKILDKRTANCVERSGVWVTDC